MKQVISQILSKLTLIPKEEIENLIEIPPSQELGDYAFPCFIIAKREKKNPVAIAQHLSAQIISKEFERVEAKGPYLNFFINRNKLAEQTIKEILKQKDKYGSSKEGKNKKIVIEMSSPNIAKPFGVGHLRSTIIGNSISNISQFLGYKPIKINYLGDWGTPFGKIITGWKKFGSESKLKRDPIKHLLELYIKVNADPELEVEARKWFKKLEDGDNEALGLWKRFRSLSLKEFDKIYSLLGIKFDVISGESFYEKKMPKVIKELESKNLLEESEGAKIVNLEKYNLGVVLIEKSDGATLYATRDLAAAIDRHNKYKFNQMLYEVGAEQKLHFKQIFKVLELLGHKWAESCIHIEHGLYLDKEGKKLASRKGTNLFMEDIINETKELAKKEIKKREKLSEKELDKRALSIALASIIYGDLKNYRANDITFDIERFISFEGNTGPYLLYTYARAKSILRKSKKKNKFEIENLNEKEKSLVLELSKFPEVVKHSYEQLSPNLIANYAYSLSQNFNEFYHSEKVIGSDNQDFRLALVESFSYVLNNSLSLLGIKTIEKM